MVHTAVQSRVKDLLQTWNTGRANGDTLSVSCDVLFCICGKWSEDSVENQRGQAVLQYILNASHFLSNVAMLLKEGKALIVFSEEEGEAVHPGETVEGLEVTVLAWTPTNTAEVMQAITNFIGSSKVGSASATQELPIQTGPFAESLISCVKQIGEANNGGELSNVSQLMGELLFVKDEEGVRDVRTAAAVCSRVYKEWVDPTLTEEMQKKEPRSLSELRDELIAVMRDPARVGLDKSPHVADFAPSLVLTPCIFHQGVYLSDLQVQDLQQMSQLTDVALRPGVVVVRFAMKNKCNTAFISRTLIVESSAPPGAKEAYEFVYKISEFVKDNLTVGSRLSEVYAKTVEYARQTDEKLAALLPKSFGFSTGLLILQQRGLIAERGSAIVSNGMSFVVRIVLEKIPCEDGSGTFDMELGDTVLVEDGAGVVCTKKFRAIEEILYTVEVKKTVSDIIKNKEFGTRSKVSGEVLVSSEEQREQKLREIAARNFASYVKGSHAEQKVEVEDMRLTELGRLAIGEVTPYPLPAGAPVPEAAKQGIYVDRDKFLVWFPVAGKPTPLHVSTITKVEVQRMGEVYTGVFDFSGCTKSNPSFKVHSNCVFLRELRYIDSTDSFSPIKEAIDDLIRVIRAKDTQRKKGAVSVARGTLKRSANPEVLRNVKVRPQVKFAGTLELHENGFRYAYLNGAPVEILFDNIKHAIFQPSFGQTNVIFHFTLKKPVVLNNKNTAMIQFYVDVLESSEAVTARRESFEAELWEDERVKRVIKNTNNMFLRFCQAAERKMGQKVLLPIQDFSFEAVHTRGLSTFRSSTDRKVLFAVSDWPPFSLDVEDVELVSLERVFPMAKTIDVTLVFSNYNTPVVTLNNVPAENIDRLKDWCLSAGLYYTISSQNPRWPAVLKEILDDKEWNPWDPEAGWALWNDDSDSEEDEEDDSDSSYEEEEDEESDDSDSSWVEDEESDFSESGSDSDDSESSDDWDALERKAEAKDRKRGRADEDDDDRPRRRPPQTRPASGAPAQVPVKVPMKTAMMSKAIPPPRRF